MCRVCGSPTAIRYRPALVLGQTVGHVKGGVEVIDVAGDRIAGAEVVDCGAGKGAGTQDSRCTAGDVAAAGDSLSGSEDGRRCRAAR